MWDWGSPGNIVRRAELRLERERGQWKLGGQQMPLEDQIHSVEKPWSNTK